MILWDPHPQSIYFLVLCFNTILGEHNKRAPGVMSDPNLPYMVLYLKCSFMGMGRWQWFTFVHTFWIVNPKLLFSMNEKMLRWVMWPMGLLMNLTAYNGRNCTYFFYCTVANVPLCIKMRYITFVHSLLFVLKQNLRTVEKMWKSRNYRKSRILEKLQFKKKVFKHF